MQIQDVESAERRIPMVKNHKIDASRRAVLIGAPAAAGFFALAELLPALAAAQNAMPLAQQRAFPLSKEEFKAITAETLADDIQTHQAKTGTTRLFNDKNFVLDLWAEKTTGPHEYEWHEHRDHIVYVLDGETVYELGGTPMRGHSIGPGEWLAPETNGSTTTTLKKGDVLVIRRGTPHKRTTEESVTFLIVSPQTPVTS
jgi:quercetin dioxygenase-like cupin family protein